MELEGGACHYCGRSVRLRVSWDQNHKDDATLDHKIPKAKGGKNDDENLILACRDCNEAKADRDYDDFLARPYRIPSGPPNPPKPKRVPRPRRYVPSPEVIEATKKADKELRWSMAAAIKRGDMNEVGCYLRASPKSEPFEVKPPQKMTALETAIWLRECAKRRGKKWPLA